VARKTGAKKEQGFKKLRNRAEKSLRKRSADLRESPVEDVQELIQELRVHQIELEMQNEDLRNAQLELAESRDRYSDLYDFAPVGYFTFDEKGLIVEANLAGADLLGFERASLIKRGFSQFVAPGSQDAFTFHRKRALETGSKQVSELELKRKNGRSFYAQLQSVGVEGNEGNPIRLRTAVVDITARKSAEAALLEAHSQLERRIVERTADLSASNAQLHEEIEERKRVERELQRSEKELHLLSSRLLTAQEDERRGIALELHDSIAQNLVAARMFLKLHLGATAGNPLPGISLERIFSMLGDCIDELRGIIDGLRPSVLEDLGLTTALNRYCAKFQSLNHGIRVKREITAQEKDIPNRLKIVIYRILQEALNNVSKHSRARTVKVSLRGGEDGIELCIEDDGVGFDVAGSQSQGLGHGVGLSSMKERAHFSGGAVSIHSRKGAGTTVLVSWHAERSNGGV
jgi:PAS domain S-box-containing protein